MAGICELQQEHTHGSTCRWGWRAVQRARPLQRLTMHAKHARASNNRPPTVDPTGHNQSKQTKQSKVHSLQGDEAGGGGGADTGAAVAHGLVAAGQEGRRGGWVGGVGGWDGNSEAQRCKPC